MMMKKRVSVKTMAIVVALMTALNVGSLTVQSIKHQGEVKQLTQENVQLQERNSQLVLDMANIEDNIVNTLIQKIEEDKSNGVKLIVFESKPSSYSKTIKEDKVFGIEKTINTAFKYSAALDMTGVIVNRVEDSRKINVTFHSDMVDIFSIEKGSMKLSSTSNIVNMLKGNKRDQMSQELLTLAEKEIQLEVTEDFENRKESILENILEKLADNYGVNAKDINITILGGK